MQQSISTRSIMCDFAASTGLSDASREPRRYLSNNFSELFRSNM